MICQHTKDTSLRKFLVEVRQSYIVIITKPFFCIVCKRRWTQRRIGRVKKNKIALSGCGNRPLKITSKDCHRLKPFRKSMDIFRNKRFPLWLVIERNIKKALFIDSIKPVKTVLIYKYKSCRLLRCSCSHILIEEIAYGIIRLLCIQRIFMVGVNVFQSGHHSFRRGLDLQIDIDKFRIDIIDRGSSWGKFQKKRAASQKRLKVMIESFGEERRDMPQQLRFATGPFHHGFHGTDTRAALTRSGEADLPTGRPYPAPYPQTRYTATYRSVPPCQQGRCAACR